MMMGTPRTGDKYSAYTDRVPLRFFEARVEVVARLRSGATGLGMGYSSSSSVVAESVEKVPGRSSLRLLLALAHEETDSMVPPLTGN